MLPAKVKIREVSAGVNTREAGRRRGGGIAYAFLLPNGIGFLAFTLIPIASSLVISLFNWPLTSNPVFVGASNYVQLFVRDPVSHRVLFNTLYFVVVYVLANLCVSLGLATWLSGSIRGANWFRVVFFLPVVTPMVANAMIWTLLYAPDGVIPWFLASALHLRGPNWSNWLGSEVWAMPAMIAMSVWAGSGYNMLIFSAGLQSIPRDVYDAASVDGANRWRQFWKITFPLLTPSIFFALVMTVITSLQVFTQPYVLTSGGPGVATTTLVLYVYNQAFQYFHMGYACAVAWALFVLIMGITIGQFVLQKRWVYYEF